MAAQLAGELAVWNARWNNIDALRDRIAELEKSDLQPAQQIGTAKKA
jgi:hypothetical protein